MPNRVSATNTHLRVGDTAPLPVFTLYDGASPASSTTWASAQLVLNDKDGEFVAVESLSFVTGATSSSTLTLAAWSTDANGSSGEYRAWIQVTNTDGTRGTYPQRIGIPITFHAEVSTSS
jgi:hypothetical protein